MNPASKSPSVAVWFAAIAALGVFTAIPIKRQLINKEGLAFPTGTATAETLRAIVSWISLAEGQTSFRYTGLPFGSLPIGSRVRSVSTVPAIA